MTGPRPSKERPSDAHSQERDGACNVSGQRWGRMLWTVWTVPIILTQKEVRSIYSI